MPTSAFFLFLITQICGHKFNDFYNVIRMWHVCTKLRFSSRRILITCRLCIYNLFVFIEFYIRNNKNNFFSCENLKIFQFLNILILIYKYNSNYYWVIIVLVLSYLSLDYILWNRSLKNSLIMKMLRNRENRTSSIIHSISQSLKWFYFLLEKCVKERKVVLYSN